MTIELDPVQYKEDLERLVASKSKFLEDIYSSDFQMVVKLPEQSLASHSQNLSILNSLRKFIGQAESIPDWLASALIGEASKSDKVTLIRDDAVYVATTQYISNYHQCRILYLANDDTTLANALTSIHKTLGSTCFMLSRDAPPQFSVEWQITNLLLKRTNLLTEAVQPLAESLGYQVF